jgi:hypothetical protein
LLAVLTGGYAFYANGDSHVYHFSAVGKVLQGQDIAEVFASQYGNEKEDAKRIATTNVRLRRDGGIERFCVEKDSIEMLSRS